MNDAMTMKEVAEYLGKHDEQFIDYYVHDYRERFDLEGESVACTKTDCSNVIGPNEKTYTSIPWKVDKDKMKPFHYGEIFCYSCAVNYVYYPTNYKIVLLKRHGPEIGGWLLKTIDRITEDLHYVDNYRFAEVGNEEEKKKYKEKRREGCCGFVDEVVTHKPTGRKFKIGCNYGH